MINRYLDLDGVVCATYPHVFNFQGIPVEAFDEYDSPVFLDAFEKVKDNEEFWLTIPVLHRPGYVPKAYVTNREIPPCLTSYWLAKNDLPYAPVVCVGNKVNAIPTGSFMVEDAPHHFEALRKAGVYCYLMDAPYNRHINTPYRIYNL